MRISLSTSPRNKTRGNSTVPKECPKLSPAAKVSDSLVQEERPTQSVFRWFRDPISHKDTFVDWGKNRFIRILPRICWYKASFSHILETFFSFLTPSSAPKNDENSTLLCTSINLRYFLCYYTLCKFAPFASLHFVICSWKNDAFNCLT